ncbi:MAG: hypothetical protein PVI57_23760, partial [Gemmatimonadota bacterium]
MSRISIRPVATVALTALLAHLAGGPAGAVAEVPPGPLDGGNGPVFSARPGGTPKVLAVLLEDVPIEGLPEAWTPVLDGLRADGVFSQRVRAGAALAAGSWSRVPADVRVSGADSALAVDDAVTALAVADVDVVVARVLVGGRTRGGGGAVGSGGDGRETGPTQVILGLERADR